MSVSSEINRLIANLADCYLAVQEKGGTLPAVQNSTNLPTAIGTIKSGATIPSPSSSRGSIQNQIIRLSAEVANSYNVCNQLGATMPVSWNTNNLADCIRSIPSYDPTAHCLNITRHASTPGIVGLHFNYYSKPKRNFEYSYDEATWITISTDEDYFSDWDITLQPGETVYIRGNNTWLNDVNHYFYIYSEDNGSTIAGNINSLFNTDLSVRILPEGIKFNSLFSDCNAKFGQIALPATTIGTTAYSYMFENCVELVNAPNLPATTLKGEQHYARMFWGCRNLVNGPEISVVNPGVSSFRDMFWACPKLENVKVHFTRWTDIFGNVISRDWMSGVSATGNFYCPSTLPQTRGDSYIPSGWTIHTY